MMALAGVLIPFYFFCMMAPFGTSSFRKQKYNNTIVFQWLSNTSPFPLSQFQKNMFRPCSPILQKYHRFEEYFIFKTRLHPNTLKYLILQYFQKVKYSLDISKKYCDANRGLTLSLFGCTELG
jgi:hypothetical protein